MDFWHKTEFFIPFALSSVTENLGDDQRAVFITRADPVAPIDMPPPSEMVLAGGDLYLGLFNKDDVGKVIDQLESDFEALDREERNDDSEPVADAKANSCFARIRLGAMGEPQFHSLDVSTLPWAIGHALNGRLDQLTAQAFEDDKARLAEALANFSSARQTEKTGEDGADGMALRGDEIAPLLELFGQWAHYQPDPALPLAVARLRYKKAAAEPQAPAENGGQDEAEAHVDQPDSADRDAMGQDDRLPEIGILNSFYLTDLELAQQQAEKTDLPSSLSAYLTPLAEQQRIDLGTNYGRMRLLDLLQPKRLNHGRWPSDPDHAMSLMQQASINAAFDYLHEGGLFSVNGPPGTGKTTLLRDVIAENLVRRARVLAKLVRAGDAFTGKTTIEIGDGTFEIGTLHGELTGYEMVIASSNNAAVENISKDLPKRDSIFLSEGDSLGYLQPVAHKLAAEQTDKKGISRCEELSERDMPWGLIACALGNAGNRRKFLDRVLFKKLPDNAAKTWAGDERPGTLWQWRERQKQQNVGENFSEAQTQFRRLDQQIDKHLQALQSLAEVQQQVIDGKLDKQGSAIERQLTTARRDLARLLADDGAALGNILAEKEDELKDLRQMQIQIERTRPSLLDVVLFRRNKQEFDQKSRENAEAQLALLNEIIQLKRQKNGDFRNLEAQLQHRIAALEQELANTQLALQQRDQQLANYRTQFPDLLLPQQLGDLELPQLQRQGLWHDRQVNQLRSQLFQAAMHLHEAWLATALLAKNNMMNQALFAIAKLLDGKQPAKPSQCLALWQNFFMIVPVISTTFASFARQFRGLPADSLGWLMIDEAGQAVPQAAVGALLRSKRALVIGDPLQIEPVLPISHPLIRALAALSDHTSSGFHSPGNSSVQILADAANEIGEFRQAADRQIWLGSPLRVHRRCLDPMFSIANSIAYNDKMVHGLTKPEPGPEAPPIGRASCWIDLAGKVSGKQMVPEQIAFAAGMVVDSYRREQQLPSLYLISPFREIKAALKAQLMRDEFWHQSGCNKPERLAQWLNRHIGTVHTFQGKEEDSVILVLGTDRDHMGAARWASSKPNILNVAVTRAKRRLYVIGDKQLWGRLSHFSTAASALPTLSPEEFLAKADASGSGL